MSWATWGWWIGAVALALAVVVAALARNAEPTLFRGRTMFRAATAVAVLSVLTTAFVNRRIPVALLVVNAAIVLASWLLRRHVLVTRHDPASAGATIGLCARRLVLSAAPRPHGFDLALPAGVLRLHVRPLSPLATLVRLDPTVQHRKTELFEQLFLKQYRRALPPIRLGSS